MIFKNTNDRSAILIFILIAIATVITRLVPPIQSPDENVHLIRADMISHGQLLLQPGPSGKGREGGMADANLIKFSDEMMGISGNGANKDITLNLLAQAGEKNWAHQESFYNAAGTGYYLPVIYLPHALGLYLSRKIDAEMRVSYEITRTLVVSASLMLLAVAFSLYTPNLLSLMLLTTPMALFQFSSPTIDGLCAAIAILAIGLWFKVSTSDRYLAEGRLSWYEIILYALIFLLCTARTNLLPILLIPFFLALRRPSRARIAAIITIYAMTLAWIGYGISTTYDARVVREYTTSEILLKYLKNPAEFFELLFRTVGDSETRRFYRDSFYGILGWLDTPIPRQAVRILYGASVVIAAVFLFITPWRLLTPIRVLLLIMGGVSIFLIFLALAITWTNYPADRISGIQGRYFLVPMLFVAAAVGQIQTEARSLRPWECVTLGSFMAYSLYVLTTTLANQYKMASLYF